MNNLNSRRLGQPEKFWLTLVGVLALAFGAFVFLDACHMPVVYKSWSTGEIRQVLDGHSRPTTWEAIKDGRYEVVWVK